jgi:hypothetical protein
MEPALPVDVLSISHYDVHHHDEDDSDPLGVVHPVNA